MRTVVHDKRSSVAARKRIAVVLACALATALLAAGSAHAQTGGATPGGTTTTPSTPTTTQSQVFPVPGAHTFGDGFGAGRRHRGQDIMAACGEPLVSVSWARVVFVGTHRRAGNYLILRHKKLGQDYAYMHLSGPLAVRKKQKVAPGQLVGYVGDTGNASTCHLHFELWVGRWYRGGRAVNPTPHLLNWDSYS